MSHAIRPTRYASPTPRRAVARAPVRIAAGLFLLAAGAVQTAAFGRDQAAVDAMAATGVDLRTLHGAITRALSLEQTLNAVDAAANDNFGISVAFHGDTALVGAHLDDTPAGADAGSAYVFVRDAGGWTQQAQLVADDAAAADGFGISVALAGETAVIGAHLDDVDGLANVGSAYVFVRSGSTWTQQAQLLADDRAAGQQFGGSVAIDGETALIGMPRRGVGTVPRIGAAYVFQRDGSAWTQQAQLLASDGARNDEFGGSVALDGDTAVIGAINGSSPASGSFTGAAYVFVRDGNTWTQQQELNRSQFIFDIDYGAAVDIVADTVLIGATNQTSPTRAGAAVVWSRSGTTWTEEARLQAQDGNLNNRYGTAVALDGEDTALIGAVLADSDSTLDTGAVYVHQRRYGTWRQQQRLQADAVASQDGFGRSVAVAGATVVIGAITDDTAAGVNAGSAYVFVDDTIFADAFE